MQRKLYLVGTDHRYQRGAAFGVPNRVFAAFQADLRCLISKYSIYGIAEEMSIDGLGIHRGVGGSLGFLIARDVGLPHRYCDPSRAERQRHGIAEHDQRERYWLAQLADFSGFPCLFILGADHVQSFSALLLCSGYAVTTLVSDWQPKLIPDPVSDGNST